MARAANDTADHEKRKDRMAQLVSDGMPLHEAGRKMRLSKGQTSRVWQNIKADLGDQAR